MPLFPSVTTFYGNRLRRNRAAQFGLVVIGFAILLAVLGHLIMPDQTPFVNDSAVQIQKKEPGYRVHLLKVRKNLDVEKRSFFNKWLFGQESAYTLMPIQSWRLDGLTLLVTPLDRAGTEQAFPLIDVVLPLYIGDSPKLPGGQQYLVTGEQITYLDVTETLRHISRAGLLAQFKKENLENRRYWLGTDKAGRDMLSRLLFGFRISLAIGFMSVIISTLIGFALGAISGFFGGWVDQVISWLKTVVWSIPSIMLVIAISLALQSKGVWVVFVAVGLTSWVEITRVVRGQILGIKQQLYVEAARSLGIGNRRVILQHILPNLIGPLVVIMTSNFASAILTEAGLSFLGLGVQPPMPSWGSMINEGFNAMGSRGSWHLILFPSLLVSLLVLAFQLVGTGLRDAVDADQLLP